MNLNLVVVVFVLGALIVTAFVCLTTIAFMAIAFGKDQVTLKAMDVFKNLFQYLPRINFPELPQDGESNKPQGKNTRTPLTE